MCARKKVARRQDRKTACCFLAQRQPDEPFTYHEWKPRLLTVVYKVARFALLHQSNPIQFELSEREREEGERGLRLEK